MTVPTCEIISLNGGSCNHLWIAIYICIKAQSDLLNHGLNILYCLALFGLLLLWVNSFVLRLRSPVGSLSMITNFLELLRIIQYIFAGTVVYSLRQTHYTSVGLSNDNGFVICEVSNSFVLFIGERILACLHRFTVKSFQFGFELSVLLTIFLLSLFLISSYRISICIFYAKGRYLFAYDNSYPWTWGQLYFHSFQYPIDWRLSNFQFWYSRHCPKIRTVF